MTSPSSSVAASSRTVPPVPPGIAPFSTRASLAALLTVTPLAPILAHRLAPISAVVEILAFVVALQAIAEIVRAPEEEAPRGLVVAALSLPFALVLAIVASLTVAGEFLAAYSVPAYDLTLPT